MYNNRFTRQDEDMDDFFKFPSTPYLVAPEGVQLREDKVLSESECAAFLRQVLPVEEKIDGANLGISFTAAGEIRLQNRGSYLRLPEPGQWKKLDAWLLPRTETLYKQLADRYMLGAMHSIPFAMTGRRAVFCLRGAGTRSFTRCG